MNKHDIRNQESWNHIKGTLRPARNLKWNICHITNPTVYENHSKTLKKIGPGGKLWTLEFLPKLRHTEIWANWGLKRTLILKKSKFYYDFHIQ